MKTGGMPGPFCSRPTSFHALDFFIIIKTIDRSCVYISLFFFVSCSLRVVLYIHLSLSLFLLAGFVILMSFDFFKILSDL